MNWIRISERLPEVKTCGEPGCPWCSSGRCCDSVLGYFDPAPSAGSRFQSVATAFFHGEHFHGNPTHWMPLPPPPKE